MLTPVDGAIPPKKPVNKMPHSAPMILTAAQAANRRQQRDNPPYLVGMERLPRTKGGARLDRRHYH